VNSKQHYRWKDDLIGAASPPNQSALKKSPDIDWGELQQPLEWPETVCRCVCKQCGLTGEIDLIYARHLLRIMSLMGNRPEVPLNIREDFHRYYFLISYCEHCLAKEVEIVLREIKRV